MSLIKIKSILSFSSEDTTSKSENIINRSGKWIGSKSGDTKQFVKIELSEPSLIKQIDIENESSAFIEILVGNLNYLDEDFEVLLQATSFMSPNESKNSLNTNRLKIFTHETDLDEKLAEKKWEVIKIVCTQPFNTNLQFGISSIKFYDGIVNEASREAAKINTGIFSLKKEVSSSEKKNESEFDKEEKTESNFEKWKKEKKTESEFDKEEKTESNFEKWKKEKKNESEFDKEEKTESNFEKWKKEKKTESEFDKEEKTETNFEKWKKEKKDKFLDQQESKTIDTKKTLKEKEYEKHGSDSKKASSQQILKGVIFALSGFQNPLRSEIRDTGIKLGAKYRPDWTDDCTHLVCAYSNTPKAALVRKKGGIIVNKDWIFDCKKEKKNLDCDDFKLEEESSDDESKPRKAARNASKKIGKLNKKSEFDDSFDEDEAENSDDKDFIADSSEEEEEIISSSSSQGSSFDSDESESKTKKKTKLSSKKKSKKVKRKKSDSESETDLEEYKKKKEKEIVEHKKRKKSPLENGKKKGIKYEDSDDEKKNEKKLKKNDSQSSKTDSNSDMDNDKSWELPSFLDNKKFFIHNDFQAKKRKQISKIIYAYGGEVSEYMAKDVSFVIADKKWNKEFDEAKEENEDLKFVESDWLELCHKRKKLIPFNIFEIVKE